MRNRFPIGFFAILALLLFYKAHAISIEIAPNEPWPFTKAIAFSDITSLLFLALAWIVAGLLPLRIIRLLSLLGIVTVTLLLTVDSLLIVSLDARLILSEIPTYLPEWRKGLLFLGYWEWFFVIVGLIISLVTIRMKTRTSLNVAGGLLAVLVLLAAVPQVPMAARVVDYYSFVGGLEGMGFGALSLQTASAVVTSNEASQYSAAFAKDSYEQWSKEEVLTLPKPGTNVILLVVESLSAVDSKLLGGPEDHLPNLDRIAKEGVVFRNFLANYGNTEGGIVSILSATEPLPFPGSISNIHRAFVRPNSVVRAFRSYGYQTEFLSNGELDFSDQAYFCHGSGFDLARGRDEVGYQGAPRTAFGCPADEYLYAEFLRRWNEIKENGKPKFFTLFTISSHLPYRDPHVMKASTHEAVWQYVDTEIGKFYASLKREGYFNNGLLIILGDHRKMLPLTESEYEKYGERAAARVPLIVVGAIAPVGRVDDRLWSQVDLFPKLRDALLNPLKQLSANVVFTDKNTVRHDLNSVNARAWVFNEHEQYPVQIEDSMVNWTGTKPADEALITNQIHRRRAAEQYAFQNREVYTCSFSLPKNVSPSADRGIELTQYRGMNILQTPSQDRFIRRATADQLTFASFDDSKIELPDESAVTLRGFVFVEKPGLYFFRLSSDDGACLGIDGKPLLEGLKTFYDDSRSINLQKGFHWLELRYFQEHGGARLNLEWLPPGKISTWESIDGALLRIAKSGSQ